MSLKITGQQTNRNERPANSLYSRFLSVASNSAVATRPTCSEATRLTKEEIAKL